MVLKGQTCAHFLLVNDERASIEENRALLDAKLLNSHKFTMFTKFTIQSGWAQVDCNIILRARVCLVGTTTKFAWPSKLCEFLMSNL